MYDFAIIGGSRNTGVIHSGVSAFVRGGVAQRAFKKSNGETRSAVFTRITIGRLYAPGHCRGACLAY